MRRLLLALLLAILASPLHAALPDKRPSAQLGAPLGDGGFLPVEQAFHLERLEDADSSRIRLRFVNADGYYLYRHRFAFQTLPAGVELGPAQLPPGEAKHDDYFGDVEVYHTGLDITLPLRSANPPPFTLLVTYQGCADKGLCYPPQTARLAIGGGAAAAEASAPPGGWRWTDLAVLFALGLGLAFTPCVLPMLPILSGVVLRGQTGGGRGLALSLAYVLPMAACFAALGALMGLFGAGLNLQARLQSPWVLVPFAAFFAVFALAMFGVYELRLPRLVAEPLDRLAGSTRGGSLWGAAALGVLSSLLVSPCVSAPLAGVLLYISASGDALGGALKLFALGLGMGAPLVLLATGGGALLPRSGPWMVGVRNAFGVLLLAVAVWLLERVLPGPLALALWGLLAAGSALALLRAVRRRGFLLPIAALLGAYAAAAAFGVLRGGDDPLRPWAAALPAGAWQTVRTPTQLDAALAAAKAAGQPLLLDWYADWCISCKVIEREVLAAPAVVERLASYRLVRFDITDSTPEQRALLDRYRLFGPPAILFFDRRGEEIGPVRVVGELSADAFARRLDQAAVER